ncbi:unnamed protein product [Echinostoma caproni]|uniref:PPM-type phosphatase domain-containing protein n=1 Tax=Echinostoma caproni TaxID=27848 RepID=A0A183B0Q8_9TREM|nr:unnamed protein product [Echinostoma caproni]
MLSAGTYGIYQGYRLATGNPTTSSSIAADRLRSIIQWGAPAYSRLTAKVAVLLTCIVNTEEFKKIDPDLAPSLPEVERGIRDGFLSLDDRLRQLPQVASGEDKSGSTAVCVLITPNHIFFANCGDSRAVLIRQGEVAFATVDHKPINPSEKERIQNAGGSVIVERVNGSLAVSRYA